MNSSSPGETTRVSRIRGAPGCPASTHSGMPFRGVAVEYGPGEALAEGNKRITDGRGDGRGAS